MVVHDYLDFRPLADAGIDFLRTAPVALAPDEAGGGERLGRPVAPVVAGAPFGHPCPVPFATHGADAWFGSDGWRSTMLRTLYANVGLPEGLNADAT